MQTLNKYIKLNAKTIAAANLCDQFDKEDLQTIGSEVFEGYQRDRTSRFKWEKRLQAAMDLAMQVQKAKSFPWPGCSNVAFPLVTIAALQFHSRAYPALISGPEVAKMRVIGPDPAGEKMARASRISTFMSWQVLEEDDSWEEQQDRLLINLPIVGTVFKKSYYDAEAGHNTSEVVLAQDLVVDYWAKSLNACPRKTHLIPFFRNQLHSNIKRKIFTDVTQEAWYGNPPGQQANEPEARRDNRIGQTPPQGDDTTPFRCLEQHVDMDLDGDGYAEPYIITIEETSKCVLRIVCGFEREEDINYTAKGEIISIRRSEYFTKYSFIPSPDGGMYDVGFGVLLGPLNETTNTMINQIADAGTMSLTAGGFLARGAKIRGGNYTFAPFQWNRVDSSGEDLSKSMVPLPVREPSAVLFQLLQLLISYVERIAGTTDTQVGENPGQNTPAETMRTMVQEGQRVYTAVYKRIWRSMKEEFKKLYVLNALFLPRRLNYGPNGVVLREDFLGNPDDVVPAADPNVTSEAMQMSQAVMLKQAAGSTPGYNVEEVERRFLKALKIDGIEQIYPGIAATGQPKDVKVQIAEMKNQTEMLWLQQEQQNFYIEMQEQVRMNDATIAKMQAEIALMSEDIQGDAEDRKIAMMNGMLSLMKDRNAETLSRMDLVKKGLEIKRAIIDASADRGNAKRLEGTSSNRGAS